MLKKLTDKQILKKAIEKAVKNGWQNKTAIAFIHWNKRTNKEIKITSSRGYYGSIFSHGFAEAFWGRKIIRLGIEMGTNKGEIVELKNWQYYLQQIVLKKEPLKYLSKFL